jgi:hypothetical protein
VVVVVVVVEEEEEEEEEVLARERARGERGGDCMSSSHDTYKDERKRYIVCSVHLKEKGDVCIEICVELRKLGTYSTLHTDHQLAIGASAFGSSRTLSS